MVFDISKRFISKAMDNGFCDLRKNLNRHVVLWDILIVYTQVTPVIYTQRQKCVISFHKGRIVTQNTVFWFNICRLWNDIIG
jgi:hypothetical protein